MKKISLSLALGLAAFAAAAPAKAADPVADFYKNKNVYLQIGSGTGGGYDIVGRLFARHIGKHIPGQPNVVPQNVTGGGSLALANQFGNTTPRDGTYFGIFNNGMPTTPLFDPKAGHFDASKFNFIGSPSREVQILTVWYNAPVQKMEDIFTKELIVGATSPGGAPYDYPLLTNALIGTKFKIITGYPSGAETKLAMQRGEIHGNPALGWASAKTDYADVLKSGEMKIVAAFGFKKHHELEQYPLMPNGNNANDEQLFRLMYARQEYGRPFLTPPDVPAERVAALRKAFLDTVRDPDFRAEATKINLEIDPVAHEELTDLTKRLYSTPKELLDRMQKIMATSAAK
jgi:tripartite-type tricarboxylate transporter receptor subunit TctC